MKILVVEDDGALRGNICEILEREGYAAVGCADGDEGLYYMENNACDLVILDRMLPGLSGAEVVRAARGKGVATPVLMLSAMNAVPDRISGLDAGADDYLTKPFEYGELLARVRALVRRPAALEADEEAGYGDLRYEPLAHVLHGPGGSVRLTGREGAMMELFLRAGGGVITKSTLFSRVWGPDSDADESNVATYVHFLRRRLRAVGSALAFRNRRGVGFCLCAEEEGPDAGD